MKESLRLMMALFLAIIFGAQAQGAVVLTSTEEMLNSAIESDDDIKLEADNAVSIPEDKNLTIDLNGHTLSRSMTAYDDKGSVIRVELDGTLTLKDCSEGKTDLSTRPRKPRLRQTDLSKRFRAMQPVMQKYKIDPDGGGNNTDD